MRARLSRAPPPLHASQYINDFGDNYRTHSFRDPRLLSQWSQHSVYHYNTPLVPNTPRALPEAHARREARLAQQSAE